MDKLREQIAEQLFLSDLSIFFRVFLDEESGYAYENVINWVEQDDLLHSYYSRRADLVLALIQPEIEQAIIKTKMDCLLDQNKNIVEAVKANIEQAKAETVGENIKLRQLLWEQHPCEAKYGDDGELQCNRSPFFIDFKRDPVDRIERYCAIHNCQRQGISIPDYLLGKPQKISG